MHHILSLFGNLRNSQGLRLFILLNFLQAILLLSFSFRWNGYLNILIAQSSSHKTCFDLIFVYWLEFHKQILLLIFL